MPEREIDDSRPFLTIPYGPADTGEVRPLPGSFTWWLCGGIRTSTYQPGEVLEVVVDVRNSGGANSASLAQVTVWWSDPALGFVIVPENLIGFRQVAVPPRGGTATTATMSRRMPPDAPNHICLIARISHPLDPAAQTPDPVNDRHWAQRNLSVVTTPGGAPAVVTFTAANPTMDAADWLLRIAPVRDAGRFVGLDQVVGEPQDDVFAVMRVDGEVGEGVLEFSIALEPGERRTFDAELEVQGLEPGRFAVFEVSQSQPEREQVFGGIGVVVVATRD
jgi:hypothetical protein